MSSISDLIDRYWDLAYAEGRENRQHDTKNGDAQDCRLEINDHIETLEGIAHQAGMERDELRMAIDRIEIENGITYDGNLWRFWSEKAKELAEKNARLEKERDYAIRWSNKAVDDVKASYEAELANIDARASEAADAVGVTPHSDMRLFVEQAVKYALNAALKTEGESR